MTQSPELAGGEGFTFEGDAAAFYLTALLAEEYAPGIDDRTVVCVSVQQSDFGEPLDDVIVDFEDTAKKPARLSLQVKRSLTISKTKTNKDFRDIIRDSWATLRKSDFRVKADRYGEGVSRRPCRSHTLVTRVILQPCVKRVNVIYRCNPSIVCIPSVFSVLDKVLRRSV